MHPAAGPEVSQARPAHAKKPFTSIRMSTGSLKWLVFWGSVKSDLHVGFFQMKPVLLKFLMVAGLFVMTAIIVVFLSVYAPGPRAAKHAHDQIKLGMNIDEVIPILDQSGGTIIGEISACETLDQCRVGAHYDKETFVKLIKEKIKEQKKYNHWSATIFLWKKGFGFPSNSFYLEFDQSGRVIEISEPGFWA